jgi:hypothetical protein
MRDNESVYIHKVREQYWHKLNNFSFCRIFENTFITCAEVFIIIRKLRICKFLIVVVVGFEL